MKLTTLKPRLATLNTDRVPVMAAGSWRKQGMTSAQRGYGYRWQQAREGWLKAYPLCVMCEQDNRVTLATVVDHRIPHRGDQTLFWDQTNWQSLCATHHSSDKQRADASGHG